MAATVAYLSTILGTRKPLDGSSPPPNLLDIEAVVLGYYGISLHDLLKIGDREALTEPRAMAYWLACNMTRIAVKDIAAHFHRAAPTICKLTKRTEEQAEHHYDHFARLRELVQLVREEATAIVPIRARLEVDATEIGQSSQQRDDGVDQHNGSDKDPDQEVDKAHERLGNPVGEDGLEAAPDEVDEACNEQNDDKLDDEIDHDTVLLSGGGVGLQPD